MNQEYALSENIDELELESFLKVVWGSDSPLSHVGKLSKDGTTEEGNARYCVINKGAEVVGCAGIKFLPDKTIELGSLAVHPDHRGKQLAGVLFQWRQTVLKKYIDEGYQLITYATLGSDVMKFIIPKMRELSPLGVYPLNLGVGIIPISKERLEANLTSPELAFNFESKWYTSTLAIMSTNRCVEYQNIEIIQGITVPELLPANPSEGRWDSSSNIHINLAPIRLDITIVNDSDHNNLPEISNNVFNQIQVPVFSEFNDIHRELRSKYAITGFGVNKQKLHLIYSNITKQKLDEILTYLYEISSEETMKRWICSVRILNKISN